MTAGDPRLEREEYKQAREGDGEGKARGTGKRAKRDTPTPTACVQCRRSKVKCDGSHPACSRCLKLAKHCIYDVPQEGVTKMQYLQQEIKRVGDNSDALLEIFEFLRCGTESAAVALLGRLRHGESIGSLLANLDGLQGLGGADAGFDGMSEDSSVSSSLHRPSIISTNDWQSDYAHAMSMSMQVAVPHPLWMPDVDGYINAEEMGRRREEMASLSRSRNGVPQASFQRIEWPG